MKSPPAFREPQLATLVDSVPAGDQWLFEMKFDGYRCIASLAGRDVRLYTRNGHDWTRQFGALVEPLGRITKGTALLDGEVCVMNADGRTDFAKLREALSNGGPLMFFAFDALEIDGEDLTAEPLLDRKLRLEALLQKGRGRGSASSSVAYSSHVLGNGQDVFDAICHDGHEGVIAKQIDAPYRGRRTRSWLKVKCGRRQEFVIVGWTPSSRKHTFASLLLGTYDGETLRYRGRVGTGFTVDEAHALQAKLDSRARKTPPVDDVPRPVARGAKWVTPDLVGEIAFTEFTTDGLLRHPSFVALRDDKAASEVVDERPSGQPPLAGPPSSKAPSAVTSAITLTSPDRVVFPGQGVTKRDLADYYDAVAERMLPFVAKRPLSLLRCPQGRAKACFFQKHDSGGFPDALRKVDITEKSGEQHEYFYVTDSAGLRAGVQMNVLEWHLWGSCIDSLEKPERLIFDIDPDEALSFADVRDAAETIAELLQQLGLETFPMLTGGKGIHVIAPIVPELEWPAVKGFCKTIAQELAAREPDRFVAVMSKARRKGRIFIDYLRNERGATAIAPWSTRARAGAPVAMPVSWSELEVLDRANAFTLANAIERSRDKDSWPNYHSISQSLRLASSTTEK